MKLVKAPAVKPITIGAFTLHEQGLDVHGKPARPEYMAVDDFVRRCTEACGFWRVDLIAYADGRADWKDVIDDMIDHETITAQAAKQARYIARNVPKSRRVTGVSFAHHCEVAGLDAGEQVPWLKRAKAEGWTRSELRHAIRHAAKSKILEGQSDAMHTIDVTVQVEAEAASPYAAEQAAWAWVKQAVKGLQDARVISAKARPR